MATLKQRLLDQYAYLPVYAYSVTPLRVRLKALEQAYNIHHAPRPRLLVQPEHEFLALHARPEMITLHLRAHLTQHNMHLSADYFLARQIAALKNQALVAAVLTAMKRLIAALHAVLPSLLADLSHGLRPRHYSLSSFRFTRRGYRGHSVAKRRRGVNG